MKPLILVGMLAGVWAAFMAMELHDKGSIKIDSGFWGGIGIHAFLVVVMVIGIWHAKRREKFMTVDGVGVVIAILLSYLTFFIGGMYYM